MASASMASTTSAFFLDTSTSRHVHHTPDLRPSRPFAIIRRRLIQNVRVRENILKIVHVQRVLPRQPRQMSLHPRPRRRVPRAPRNLVDLRTKLRQRSSRDFLLRLSLPTHRLRRSRPTRVRSRARPSAHARIPVARSSLRTSVRSASFRRDSTARRRVSASAPSRVARGRARRDRARRSARARTRRSTRARGPRRALARPTPRAAPRRRRSVCESVRGRSNTRSTLVVTRRRRESQPCTRLRNSDSAAPARGSVRRASAHRERARTASERTARATRTTRDDETARDGRPRERNANRDRDCESTDVGKSRRARAREIGAAAIEAR